MIEYLFVDKAPAAQPMSAYISVQCFGGHFKNWEGSVGVGFGGITSMGSGYCPGGSVIVVRPVARLETGGRGGEACEVTAVDVPDGQKQLLIWFKELREENGQIRCAVETELPDVLNP
ncbi:hypothetical protein ACFOGJ_21545 [Marinibaculum pumilum]|uniref:Uncharacterized protein n=1 Tax=Marinibaculum pumilum TaxID=1766165 RepID=A0ABV7L5M8_9PROT